MFPLTPEDRDLAIRTLFGEAATDPASQAAVAAVILNRAKQSNAAVKDVVLAPKQFEPWGSRKQELLGLDQNSQDYQNLGTILDAVASGETPDPTGGATLFYSPGAQKALGRKTPKWAQGEGLDIGQHRFFTGAFPTPKGGKMNTIVAGLDPGIPLRKPEMPAQQPIAPASQATAFAALSAPQKTGGGFSQASALFGAEQDQDMEAVALAMEQAGMPEQHIAMATGLIKQGGRWVQNA